MTIKVRMVPHIDDYRKEESGIKRVVEAWHRHLPKFDIELVDRETKRENFDLLVVHAGAYDGPCDIAVCHGLYWTSDYSSAAWEWRTNSRVITNIRHAKEVIVPSAWVAETFQRDMRFTPHIIGHGIDFDAWQGVRDKRDHVLWAKNRVSDVCNPEAVRILAEAFPDRTFVSTFKLWDLENIQVTGVISFPEMREYMMTASVYLSTVPETFCIGNLEAMASGVPILGFAEAGNLIMVDHGVNGYLAKPGDWGDLINGLTYCLEHGKTLGDNGREMSKAWTWEKACSKVADVFKLAMINNENQPMKIEPSLYEIKKAVA